MGVKEFNAHVLRAEEIVGGRSERHGKYEEAEEMHRQALALRESALRKKHPETLTSIYYLTYLLYQRKEYKDAAVFYHRVYAEYSSTLGDDHPTTAAYYSSMLEQENG